MLKVVIIISDIDKRNKILEKREKKNDKKRIKEKKKSGKKKSRDKKKVLCKIQKFQLGRKILVACVLCILNLGAKV